MRDYYLNHTAFVFLRCSLFSFGRFVYTFLTLESFADELSFGLSSKSTLKIVCENGEFVKIRQKLTKNRHY